MHAYEQDVLVKRGNHYMVDFRQFHETVPVSGELLDFVCLLCASNLSACAFTGACLHALWQRPLARMPAWPEFVLA